jgi:hypothetical protein
LPEPDLSFAGLDDELASPPDSPTDDTTRAEPDASAPPSDPMESAPAAEEGVDRVLEALSADEDAREPSAIHSRFGPRSIPADAGGDCPPDHPVKGNANSMIYHLPGQSSYGATRAEVCFPDGEAAEEVGFRPRKR